MFAAFSLLVTIALTSPHPQPSAARLLHHQRFAAPNSASPLWLHASQSPRSSLCYKKCVLHDSPRPQYTYKPLLLLLPSPQLWTIRRALRRCDVEMRHSVLCMYHRRINYPGFVNDRDIEGCRCRVECEFGDLVVSEISDIVRTEEIHFQYCFLQFLKCRVSPNPGATHIHRGIGHCVCVPGTRPHGIVQSTVQTVGNHIELQKETHGDTGDIRRS
mmetsp:Transcript_38575/g.44955  ORF Transcript_38575/g.44955 Transcript_38575/m.44955 type:complete len:216 (-) Transcript_38575:191-838(-)